MKRCLELTEEQINQLSQVVKDGKRSGREVRRAQAILLLDKKAKIENIKKTTFYQRRQIYELREQYLKTGIKAIEDQRKGKPKCLLTRKQLKEIDQTLKTKTPEEFGYDYPFWTTGILGDWIKRKYAVKYKSKNLSLLNLQRS